MANEPDQAILSSEVEAEKTADRPHRITVWITALALVTTVASAVAAWRSWVTSASAHEIAREVAYLSRVSTRIQVCMNLSAHHARVGNQTRSDASANLGRALDMCLVYPGKVETCVEGLRIHPKKEHLVPDLDENLAC